MNSSGFTAKAPNGEDIDTFEDDGYENRTSSIKSGINLFKNGKLEIGNSNIKSIS